MPASLSRITFNVGPLCTSLISTLLSLARSRHKHTIPLDLGARMNVLHHSEVSFMPRSTIICCFCSLSSSFFRDSWRVYSTLLGTTWCGWLSFLIYRVFMPSKHPIPGKNHKIHCVLFINT